MEVLKPLIDQLVKMIQNGQDVLSGQLPDVAKQLLAYQLWSAHLWMWVFIWIAIAILISVVVAIIGNIDIWPFFGFIILITVFLGIFYEYDQMKEIQLAPKVYLIEQLKAMSK